MPTREQEEEAKVIRRIERWYNSLTPEQQVPNPQVIAKLKADGYLDENGLTPAGELYMHQLRQLEWMYKWRAKKAKEREERERSKSSNEANP